MSDGPAPRISIVLPVFNGERYLAASIDSCLEQSEGALELIIVDDASTDGTAALVRGEGALDDRVACIRNPTNLRLPASLNEGFRHAHGRYFTWTSDDNLFAPTALERMARVLDADAGVDIVYADYTMIDPDDRVLERRTAPDVRHLGYSNVIGPCFLYRAEVHATLGGFDETCFLAEDYDFWLRAAVRFRFAHLAEDLYRYRSHPGSLGVSRQAEVQEAVGRVLARRVGGLPRAWRAGGYARLLELARARGDRRAMRSATFGWLSSAPLSFLRDGARRILGRRRPPTDPPSPR